jgi:hypothetical protein
MEDLVRYRAMESLCRQCAAYRPMDSWRLLAEAEMWHHKAEAEIDSRLRRSNRVTLDAAVAKKGVIPAQAIRTTA